MAGREERCFDGSKEHFSLFTPGSRVNLFLILMSKGAVRTEIVQAFVLWLKYWQAANINQGSSCNFEIRLVV